MATSTEDITSILSDIIDSVTPAVITDDLILSLEYYHDNPENKKFFEAENGFFDLINNRKINLVKFNSEPELLLKEKLF